MARVDTDAGHLRLPADRRSAPRPGPSWEGAGQAVLSLLDHVVQGDLEGLSGLLVGPASESLARLVSASGRAALSSSLRKTGRALLDCKLERLVDLPDGGAECRMRLFQLLPGGQIRSCCWVVQARQEAGF